MQPLITLGLKRRSAVAEYKKQQAKDGKGVHILQPDTNGNRVTLVCNDFGKSCDQCVTIASKQCTKGGKLTYSWGIVTENRDGWPPYTPNHSQSCDSIPSVSVSIAAKLLSEKLLPNGMNHVGADCAFNITRSA